MARNKVTKEALLDIAYKIAIEQGLSALSVRSICLEAHIAVGTFYNYFESVDDLIYQMSVLFFEKNVRDKLCAPTEDETFLSFIRRMYPVLKSALTTFNINWIKQINVHSTLTQSKNFFEDRGIKTHAAMQLARLIKRDLARGVYTLPQDVSPEQLAAYSFDTIYRAIEEDFDPEVLFWLLDSTLKS